MSNAKRPTPNTCSAEPLPLPPFPPSPQSFLLSALTAARVEERPGETTQRTCEVDRETVCVPQAPGGIAVNGALAVQLGHLALEVAAAAGLNTKRTSTSSSSSSSHSCSQSEQAELSKKITATNHPPTGDPNHTQTHTQTHGRTQTRQYARGCDGTGAPPP